MILSTYGIGGLRDHFMNTTLQSQCFLIFHMIGVIVEIDRLFLIVFFIGNTSNNNICGVYSSQPSWYL